MSIKAVLFDLDGTLIDTAPDFIRIIRHLCQSDGIDCPSDTAIREQVSAGSWAMVRLMTGLDRDDPKLMLYRERLLAAYEANICVDTRLFDGLDELLMTLQKKAIVWGIVTNKPRHLTEILLDKMSLADRCSVLVCPDDVKNTKPDPEPLFLACQKLRLAPDCCLYVGDHVRDIEAGRAAGMQTVAAEFGYLTQEDRQNLHSWGADKIVATPAELVSYVLSCIDVSCET